MGVIAGSFYKSLGVNSPSTDDQIRAASRRYADRSRFEDCLPLTDWIGDEAIRVLTNPEIRSEYDSLLKTNPAANWPTSLPFDIRIAEQGLPPIVKQTFCDRCSGYPARDVTIPRMRLPSMAMLETIFGDVEQQPDPLRGASSLVKRRCRECGALCLGVVRYKLLDPVERFPKTTGHSET